MTIQLRPYQLRANAEIREAMANELVEELLVTHPRGARKTEVDHG